MAPKFNHMKTIDELRGGMESLTRLTKLPSKTRVEKIILNSISAEWICAKDACEDRVILYLHGGGYNIGSPDTHRELAANISMLVAVPGEASGFTRCIPSTTQTMGGAATAALATRVKAAVTANTMIELLMISTLTTRFLFIGPP